MSKVWYCVNCGYEVGSRGKCHSCGERLTQSSLPELISDSEDDEVGYRLGGWDDGDRGRLIEQLNRMEILHRFEEEELVVGAEDEERVDDLIAEVASAALATDGSAHADGDDREGSGGEAPDYSQRGDPATVGAVKLLYGACQRLRVDPTDMSAEVDAAEASTVVFMSDFYPGADDETWAAVGRVIRRLLGALAAEEALEDEIRSQAAVLQKLLAPLVGDAGKAPRGEVPEAPSVVVAGSAETPAVTAGSTDWTPSDGTGGHGTEAPRRADGDAEPGAVSDAPTDAESDAPTDADSDAQRDAGADAGTDADTDAESGPGETVYELTEWLPEERAQLDVLLDEAGIRFEWDADELIVPSDREIEVERLFEQVRGAAGMDDDGETRYHAIEELFAAAGRLVSDPADEQRQADAAARITDVIGPPPFGFDEVHWLRIMKLSRALAEQIETNGDILEIHDSASELRDLLRTVV